MQNKFGVDVAIRRADDLDKKMLKAVSDKTNASVLDIGCGVGGQSLRLVQAGAKVLGLDIQDNSQIFAELLKEYNLSADSLRFVQGDMTNFLELVSGEKFTECCIQRALHYVSYAEAKQVLTDLKSVVYGRLYISVTGLGSEIGVNYGDKNKIISHRFCKLSVGARETFSIFQPVCLYTKKELIELLESSSWQVEEVWLSAFGNIKAVCI